jgi:hypothetical protein
MFRLVSQTRHGMRTHTAESAVNVRISISPDRTALCDCSLHIIKLITTIVKGLIINNRTSIRVQRMHNLTKLFLMQLQ